MYDPDFISDGYYHVYNRTNNRELLFKNFNNYHFFLNRYDYYLNSSVQKIGYCLMPTHFHFLIRVKPNLELKALFKNNLSIHIEEQFRRLFVCYTKSINIQQKRHGSLFQRPFKRTFISDRSDVVRKLCYIHHNPIHHGLANDYHKWKFSSYNQWKRSDYYNQLSSIQLFNLKPEALFKEHKMFKQEYEHHSTDPIN